MGGAIIIIRKPIPYHNHHIGFHYNLAIDKSTAIHPVFNALHKMIWKFIIIGLSGIDDGDSFNQDSIWDAAIKRLLLRMRTMAYGAQVKLMKWKGINNELPDDLIKKLLSPTRAKINPLGNITDRAELQLHPSFHNELIKAGLDKNRLERAFES